MAMVFSGRAGLVQGVKMHVGDVQHFDCFVLVCGMCKNVLHVVGVYRQAYNCRQQKQR